MGRGGVCSITTPAPRGTWSALVADDPDAVVEQAPLWIDALVARGFVDNSRLYEFDDGLQFVLPLVGRGKHHLRPRTGFVTGWGIGGIVGPGLAAEHVSAIIADLAGLSAVYVHLRPNPLQGATWATANTAPATKIERRAHVVDLSGGADETWKRFRTSGRRGVTKATRAGVQVELHTGGEKLERYYDDLFIGSVNRWAQRQREPLALAQFRAKRRDPLAKLTAIASTLGDQFRLYLASVDGQLVAGNIVVWGPNAHATRAAMDYEPARVSSASYALEWASIEDACTAGHRWYQMGESGQNKTLAEYKERFGAVPIDYAEYRIERLPLLAADRRARAVVKRVIGFRD